MNRVDKPNLIKDNYTIGVLASTLLDENGRDLWYGLVDSAKERKYNTFYFAGGWLKDPYGFNSQSNIIYDLIDRQNVDGLIIWTSALGRFISEEELQQFCEKYRPLPIVSLGAPISGVPSVLIDSYQAMSDLISHLIEVHDRKRIAFIRGPAGHYDSEERLRAYKDVLKKYRIEFNPDLLSNPGFWNTTHSKDSIQQFLDGRGVSFDAVVCSSDSFVEGAYNELHSRGFKIPDDISLVGCDNKPSCRTMDPPLTTVPIMMYERVQEAADILVQMLNGNSVPDKLSVPCPLIIRRSCGCNPLTGCKTQPDPSIAATSVTDLSQIFKQHRGQIKQALNGLFNSKAKSFEPDWDEKLLDSMIDELANNSTGSFVATFDSIFTKLENESQNLTKWYQVLSAFQPNSQWQLNNSQYQLIMSILDQVKNYLLEMEIKIESKRRQQMEQFTEKLIGIGYSLTATCSIKELTTISAEELPKLEMPSSYICLYDQPGESIDWARLILAQKQSRLIPTKIEEGGLKFPARQLIPKEFLNHGQTWDKIVEPIFYREHQLGYVVFEVGPKEASIYAMLRTQLSSALWGALFFEKQKQTEAALAKKAQELARSNSELERFAYVASHDLQEPLRKIIIFGESLQRTIRPKLNDKEKDYLGRMIHAADRMQHLIYDLLSFSRVTTKAQPFVRVDLDEVAKEVISDLEAQIRRTKADIQLVPLPSIEAEPVQIRQLFQNMIGNAIKFHRDNVPPIVKIYGSLIPGQQCELVFEDNGIGIGPDNYQKIFRIFERLHGIGKYEGSGVGLAICHKIVERHKGEIKVESKVGLGTKFIIRLPVHQ